MNTLRHSALVAAFGFSLGGCGGGGGSSSPPPPPPPPPTISAFAATPSAITPGSSSTLAWTVSGATSLKVDQGVGSVAGTGVAVQPQATTTYTLTATNGGGSSTATTTVRVGDAPVISSFRASPSWVTTGQSAALTWSVSGATALSIDAIGSVSGSSVQVTPAADASYVLTASNDFGSAQAQATLAVFPPPNIWFAPLPPNMFPNYGSLDYLDLFNSTAPWVNAASHIQVFKLYAPALSFPDADVRNLFADLKRRHIALALEQGGLMVVNGVSCYGDFGGNNALGYMQRIRDLGGSLQYVALDEPFYAVTGQMPDACHWTIQQTVDNVSLTVAAVRSVFPDAVIGDIEVVPDVDVSDTWLTMYQQWVDAWQATTGKPFGFFHFDVDWATNWRPAVSALSRALRDRRIPVGQIYNAGVAVTTDAAWVESAEQRMTDFETHGSPAPDQVIFQSWDPRPYHLLPESDPSSFTYLIDRYFRDRTLLTLSATGGVATGALTGPSGPLANATVALTGVPLVGNGQAAAYTYSGVIPAGTKYVAFGARVATENCGTDPLPAEFLLTDFALDAGAAGRLHADFTNGLNGWGISGNAAIAQVEQTNLHIQVLSGQTLSLGSVSQALAADGVAYTLTVNATIPVGSLGSGCAVAFFQDASISELARVALHIVPQSVGLGTVQTDPSGAYALGLAPQSAPFDLWADYTGSASMWPASASTLIGQVPALAIATTSLPDGAVAGAYAQALIATGGRSPYLWVGGGVPPGLVLGQDGTLSGTPTAAGTYTVSLSVVDNSAPAQVVDTSFKLVVH